MASSTFFVFLLLLGSFKEGKTHSNASAETQSTAGGFTHHLSQSHRIQVSSLLPSTLCNPSAKAGATKASSLKVVHRHGPCSPLSQGKSNPPTHDQILQQDQERVDSIHSRVSKRLSPHRGSKATTLPAKHGSTIGSGNYVVTVGLGTPKKDLTLAFDTGSDLTWTQCVPCIRSCYRQSEPIFDPSKSSSYNNVSCTEPACTDLLSITGVRSGCSGSTCLYGIGYGDSSYSVGFFARETLTLTPTDAFSGFLFGCGENNRGLFRGAAGLLGLGRNKLSIVEQTAYKYGKIFSYCLPSSPSSIGHLTFGYGAASPRIKYTPFSRTSQSSSFYALDITGISVGGRPLPIPTTVFSDAGSIIDSGTVITRLPPLAYSALKEAFKKLMKMYPSAPALSILDTCYDFSKYKTISIPKIVFFLAGGVAVDLDATGILFAASVSRVCLAFAGNEHASDTAIFGNVQQQKLEVVYDGARARVGFGPNGCA